MQDDVLERVKFHSAASGQGRQPPYLSLSGLPCIPKQKAGPLGNIRLHLTFECGVHTTTRSSMTNPCLSESQGFEKKGLTKQASHEDNVQKHLSIAASPCPARIIFSKLPRLANAETLLLLYPNFNALEMDPTNITV